MITLSLPGSTYVYQGEELGLPEVWDLPESVLDDPTWERSERAEKGRDGCRVPIPWTADGPSFGFGDAEPWLPQPEVFGELAAGEQANDAMSMLSLYRSAIAMRREIFAGSPDFELLSGPAGVLAYSRGAVTVMVNMGGDSVELPDGEVLLASSPIDGTTLGSDTAAWIRTA